MISFIYIILSIMSFVATWILYKYILYGYCILSITLGIVFLLLGISNLLKNQSPEKKYNSEIKDILKTFDSVLVKSSEIPNLDNRNIIEVESIDDLVDAQLEIRKPICYLKQTESCSFVLLDDKEAYIYVAKINENILSPIEIVIKESKIKSKNREEMDSEMLRDIEKTTIVKLSNKKSYKISPVRKKENKVKQMIYDDIELL